jgi:hypothetical protein
MRIKKTWKSKVSSWNHNEELRDFFVYIAISKETTIYNNGAFVDNRLKILLHDGTNQKERIQINGFVIFTY